MLQFLSENPSTLGSKPLSDYERTFWRIQVQALNRREGCVSLFEGKNHKAQGIAPMELGGYGVLIFRQDSFTVATIVHDGVPVAFGCAKRHKGDRENPKKSEHLAVRRAIQNCFVDEVKDLSRPADNFVFMVDGQWSEEEMAAAKEALKTPGMPVQVTRFKNIERVDAHFNLIQRIDKLEEANKTAEGFHT